MKYISIKIRKIIYRRGGRSPKIFLHLLRHGVSNESTYNLEEEDLDWIWEGCPGGDRMCLRGDARRQHDD